MTSKHAAARAGSEDMRFCVQTEVQRKNKGQTGCSLHSTQNSDMGQCLGKPPGGMKPGQQPYHQNGGMGYQQNGYNNQYQQGQDTATEAVHGGFEFSSQRGEPEAVSNGS